MTHRALSILYPNPQLYSPSISDYNKIGTVAGISCSGTNPTTMVRCEVLINDNDIVITSTEWQNSKGQIVGGNANAVLKSLQPKYCFVRLSDRITSQSKTRILTSTYNKL